jgi:hypothetical protein
MRARRQDSNSAAIVKALRKIGVQVYDTGRMAQFIPGFPDLLVVGVGQVHLLEIKTENGELTKDQIDFHAEWRGPPIIIVRSPEEAVMWASNERMRFFR